MDLKKLFAEKIAPFVDSEQIEYLTKNMYSVRKKQNGVSRQYVEQLIRGEGLTIQKIEEICKLLDLDISVFVERKRERK